MQAVKTKGLSLSGKARRRHKAGRAARLFDQQLIMDYLETADAPSQHHDGVRPVPVGHRRESLVPSALTFEHVAKSADDQLELPLQDKEPASEEAICFVRASKPSAVQAPQNQTSSAVKDRKAGRESAADSLAASWTIWRPKRRNHRSSNPGFTISGFLYGCAMGAAAAGLALVVLQASIG